MLRGIFSLRYLKLRTSNEVLLLRRDAVVLAGVAVLYVALAYFIENVNYFGPDGLIDRIGSLTSTLTGFYVAALVAAATFASSHADLDDEIRIGPIHESYLVDGEVIRDQLTRREYVCSIFGYVSLLALVLSITSILCVTIASAVQLPTSASSSLDWTIWTFKHTFGALFAVFTAHLFVTTCHGLYYLSYRLYIGDGKVVPGAWEDADLKEPVASTKLKSFESD